MALREAACLANHEIFDRLRATSDINAKKSEVLMNSVMSNDIGFFSHIIGDPELNLQARACEILEHVGHEEKTQFLEALLQTGRFRPTGLELHSAFMKSETVISDWGKDQLAAYFRVRRDDQ